MKKLLKFEFRKLFKNPFTYICLVSFLIFTILGVIATNYGISATDMTPEPITINKLSLSAITPILGYPMFFVVLSVFVSFFVCNDSKKNGVMKNVYAKGYSRENVFFVKYLITLICTIVITLICFLFSFIVAVILLGSASGFSGKVILNFLLQLIIVIGMHGLIFAIAAKVGKIGGSLILNILLQIFLPGLLILLQMFVGGGLNTTFNFYYLFPSAILNLLTTINLSTGAIISSVVTSIAYVLLCLPLSFLSIRKREY